MINKFVEFIFVKNYPCVFVVICQFTGLLKGKPIPKFSCQVFIMSVYIILYKWHNYTS